MNDDTQQSPPEQILEEESFEWLDLGDAIEKTEGPVGGLFFDGGGRWG